jgi:hypothetical protein
MFKVTSRAAKAAYLLAPAVLFSVHALADLDGSYVLPLDHEAIRYETAPVRDAVTHLREQLVSGEVKLEFDAARGYLPSLLKALHIPVSSQVLVFSKTSFQAPRISPSTPRALYFDDHVYVGWVRDGDVVEIAAVDPEQGVIFYTLDQQQTSKPQIARRGECLQCHASGQTLGVPGLVVRSVFPEPSGMPLFQAGSFVTDHRSPLKERWGGWYVTGTHGSQQHMGNVTFANPEKPDQIDRAKGANVTDLKGRFDTGPYLSAHSDIVALLVLEHQTRMTNLITRVGYETRMAMQYQAAMNTALHEPAGQISDSTKRRIESAAEELVRYLLFTDEARLESPIKGTSNFASEFTTRGPRDKRGRSLRDLDLTHRLLRYPCSYLIYSEAFDKLPEPAKTYVLRRIWEVLTGQDRSKEYAGISNADRQAVLEILTDTKPNLPDYWKPTS